MTETEQKIVRVLSVNVPNTLCDMYRELRSLQVTVESCEIDKPLGDLCERGVVRQVGKEQCARRDRCLTCNGNPTLAYVLAAEMERPSGKPRPLPEPPSRATEARVNVTIERNGDPTITLTRIVKAWRIDRVSEGLTTIAFGDDVTMSGDENAKQIGKLLARVCQLEGLTKAMSQRIRDIAETTADGFELVGDDEPLRASSAMQKLVEAAKADEAALADSSVPGYVHSDSGRRQRTWHGGTKRWGDPSIKCRGCGEWIRPEDMGQECEDVPAPS